MSTIRSNGLSLPTFAAACLGALWEGQSNVLQANEAPPIRISSAYAIVRREGEIARRTGYIERPGMHTRDQAVSQALEAELGTRMSFHGSQVKFAQDLITAGRIPVMAMLGRSGTNITRFQSGGSCKAIFDAFWAEFGSYFGARPLLWIWSQGESDAQIAGDATNYETRFDEVVQYRKSQLPVGSILLARLLPTTGALTDGAAGARITTINSGITNVMTARGGFTLNTNTAATAGFSNPHFTSPGQVSLGASEAAFALAQGTL